MTSVRSRMCIAVLLSFLAAACATTSKEKQDTAQPQAAANTEPANRKETQPRVTFQSDEDYVGDIIHGIGQKSGGSLVLVNGAELRIAGPVNFRQTNFTAVADNLANSANCAIQECNGYLFMYPDDAPEYEKLTNISLTGKLDPAFGSITTAMTFGYGTRIHAAFAVLSHVLGITVVADNAVADVK